MGVVMPDQIDIANDLIDNELALALRKAKQNTGQNKEGTKFCVECGEDMPEARRQLGFNFCVPCATERERRQALFADE